MWEESNGLLQTVTWLALQYEGAAMKDGKGRSIWDTYSHTEGEFLQGYYDFLRMQCEYV